MEINFDDYDNHILLKYRLAIAIGIIRNAPQNIKPEIYLQRIRNHIISKMESIDQNITICEEDFEFNDDDNDKTSNDKANNETQFIDTEMNDSVTILKDFDFNEMIKSMQNDDCNNIAENNSVTNVLRILKGVDDTEMVEAEIVCAGSNVNHTQSTYYESSQSQCLWENINKTQENAKELPNTSIYSQYDKTTTNNEIFHKRIVNGNTVENATFYDTQGTNNLNEFTDNYTHISQSQNNNIVVPKYLFEKGTLKDSKTEVFSDKVKQNTNVVVNKFTDNKDIIENKELYKKTTTDVLNTTSLVNINKRHNCTTQDNIEHTSKRIRETINCNDGVNSTTDAAYFNEIKSKLNLNPESDFESHLNKNPETIEVNDLFNRTVLNDTLINFRSQDENKLTNIIDLNNINNADNIEITNPFALNTIKSTYNSQASQISLDFNFELSNQNREAIVNAKLTNENKEEECQAEEEEEENIIEELYDKLTDSQTDAVQFKVLEELNKIKAYLLRRDRRNSSGCVSDSGYKSDSLSRSSFKTAVRSGDGWLDQSAHCLLSHLQQCPLLASTEDITSEISRTLGRLIDKLHEEEKYPSFLDELLQSVAGLLKSIYEEESDNNQLMKKDENIHRLFLLNKSSHIIKYTTDKIISILEDVLTKITDEEELEITDICQTENLSYIFHILETLLKKIIAHKNFSSQSSAQNTQEDEGILKKSSLTDMWRRKWNLEKRSGEYPSSNPKQCVLERCSGVLNRLIVQALDGYSLVSYSGLQCFNLLQN